MAQRVTITVTYGDGETESLPIRPVGIVAAERRFGGDMPQVEGSLYAAWYGVRAGNPDLPDFDEWLNSLDAIDADGGDDTDADPTDAD